MKPKEFNYEEIQGKYYKVLATDKDKGMEIPYAEYAMNALRPENFIPADNRILVLLDKDSGNASTAGGILVSTHINTEGAPQQGLIVVCNEKYNYDNKEMPFKEGMRIVFSEFAGSELKFPDMSISLLQKYKVIRATDVWGVFESNLQPSAEPRVSPHQSEGEGC